MKPAFSKLPTLADLRRAPRAMPKKATQLQDKTAEKRDDEKKLAAMRKEVWRRDDSTCQLCKCRVIRSLALVGNRGEVHHRRGRRVAPEDKFRAESCVLLCARCHEKVTRREVKL